MIPIREIKKGGKPIAIFLTKAGEIKFIKVSDIKGRTFFCTYGAFQLQDTYRYNIGKRDVYFYHVSNANPLSIESIVKIKQFLDRKYLSSLSVQDIKNAALDPDFSKSVGSNTLRFIENYYNVDTHAKTDVLYDASVKKNFRLRQSFNLIAYIPQNALFWRNVALVIINDRILDIVRVEVRQEILEENNEPATFIYSDKYGKFEVKDAKTRYRKGKTNVYIIAVRTIRSIQNV